MDVIARIQREMAAEKDIPDTLIFGYAFGVKRRILIEGDSDRKVMSALALIHEAIGLLMEEMRKEKMLRDVIEKDAKYLREAAKMAVVCQRRLHRTRRRAVRRRE